LVQYSSALLAAMANAFLRMVLVGFAAFQQGWAMVECNGVEFDLCDYKATPPSPTPSSSSCIADEFDLCDYKVSAPTPVPAPMPTPIPTSSSLPPQKPLGYSPAGATMTIMKYEDEPCKSVSTLERLNFDSCNSECGSDQGHSALVIDFGKQMTMTSFKFDDKTWVATEYVKRFSLAASDDGSTWKTFHGPFDRDSLSDYEVVVSFSPVSGRYFRWSLLSHICATVQSAEWVGGEGAFMQPTATTGTTTSTAAPASSSCGTAGEMDLCDYKNAAPASSSCGTAGEMDLCDYKNSEGDEPADGAKEQSPTMWLVCAAAAAGIFLLEKPLHDHTS